MRIAFLNLTPMNYSVSTPYNSPLGGSESAMCYLAEALAKRGHEVVLGTHQDKKVKDRGVWCIPKDEFTRELMSSLDVFIIQNTPYIAQEVKPLLGEKTKMIFWSQHDSDQPAVKILSDGYLTNCLDAVVLLSNYQLTTYLRDFRIPKEKYKVIGNAISPCFENLFKSDPLSFKKTPFKLTYTSTPFRGLNLLTDLFPAIKHEFKESTLEVYSSMQVYQVPEANDLEVYGNLYQKLKALKGVSYFGSLSQTKLADRLKRALILTYPNTFPETSCIAVMEAMAAGLYVVTSDLGALKETLSGYGKLLTADISSLEYRQQFCDEVVSYLQKVYKNPKEVNKNLIIQIEYVNSNYVWSKRAIEWEDLFNNISVSEKQS
jgi:glycosyltransferase involved in cell wall biosynthesis